MDSFFRSHKYLGSHDRRFIAESVYGTLRHLRRCEYILFRALGDEVPSIKPEEGHLLLIVTYLVAVEKTKIVAADILQKLSSPDLREQVTRLLSAMAFDVPLPEGDRIEQMGIAFSYPDWMVRKVAEQFGEDQAWRIFESLNEPAPLTLRVNSLKTTPAECEQALKTQEINTTRTGFSPMGLRIAKRLNVFSLPSFQDGLFEVQDEGSQILPLLVDPKPTDKVLDACAGAGGKSLAFAALMKNRGEIYATDTNGYRLKELKKRSRRAGAFNIRPLEVHNLGELSEKYRGSFDIVFVDAPCSGLGTIRRNPGMKWTVTEDTVREVSEKQAEILRQCAVLVKPHGRLIYATCTLLREENEDIVSRFLAGNTVFKPVLPEKMIAQIGLETAKTGEFIRLLPHVHGTDGFFCAMLERSE